ncbi:hypothetical protein L1887_48041 [Cichorium endivia]|nr:hypothetical protein L1887_48041 [Cichorium endivia]
MQGHVGDADTEVQQLAVGGLLLWPSCSPNVSLVSAAARCSGHPDFEPKRRKSSELLAAGWLLGRGCGAQPQKQDAEHQKRASALSPPSARDELVFETLQCKNPPCHQGAPIKNQSRARGPASQREESRAYEPRVASRIDVRQAEQGPTDGGRGQAEAEGKAKWRQRASQAQPSRQPGWPVRWAAHLLVCPRPAIGRLQSSTLRVLRSASVHRPSPLPSSLPFIRSITIPPPLLPSTNSAAEKNTSRSPSTTLQHLSPRTIVPATLHRSAILGLASNCSASLVRPAPTHSISRGSHLQLPHHPRTTNTLCIFELAASQHSSRAATASSVRVTPPSPYPLAPPPSKR